MSTTDADDQSGGAGSPPAGATGKRAKPEEGAGGDEGHANVLRSYAQHRLRNRLWGGSIFAGFGLVQGIAVFWLGLCYFDDFYEMLFRGVGKTSRLEGAVEFHLAFITLHAALVAGGMLFASLLIWTGVRMLADPGESSAPGGPGDAFPPTEFAKAVLTGTQGVVGEVLKVLKPGKE